jgi:hypothetical protein
LLAQQSLVIDIESRLTTPRLPTHSFLSSSKDKKKTPQARTHNPIGLLPCSINKSNQNETVHPRQWHLAIFFHVIFFSFFFPHCDSYSKHIDSAPKKVMTESVIIPIPTSLHRHHSMDAPRVARRYILWRAPLRA